MLNDPVKIDPDFKAVCPPLTKEERGELRESIKRDGCREGILTWRGFIVDGHNRYEICEELHKPYTTRPVELTSRGEVIQWIIRNQFARRNLTAMQRAELALKLKDAVAAEAKKRQGARNDLKAKTNIPPKLAGSSKETRDKLAKMANVSHGTLAKVEKIVAEAEPEVVEAARRGDMSINAAFRTIASEPREAAPEPSEPTVDVDAPESEERATEPPRPLPAAPVAEPPRRMKNWERFSNWREAVDAFNRECGGAVIRCNWYGIGDWMYMDFIEGESRLDFLKRCDNLTAEGRKELARLEKSERKGAAK